MKEKNTISQDMREIGDRRAIWTDCPHCARKHLLAAYALLTQDTGTEISVTACGLLLARSEILLGEAITGGYIGNAALAAGCLAAVEGVAHTNFGESTRCQLRQIRLDLDALNLTEALFGLGRLLPTDMSGRHVAAHLTEARRELPELGDMPGIGTFDGGYRHTNCSELRDWLVKTVRQLEETYELGAGSGDPIWQSGTPTFRKKEGKTNGN
jgi:hypothetical protein